MLKWTIRVYDPYTFGILNSRNQRIAVIEGNNKQAVEALVAAHNAVIDMAFDSPGNVS